MSREIQEFKDSVGELTKDIMFDLLTKRFRKYDNLCKTFE